MSNIKLSDRFSGIKRWITLILLGFTLFISGIVFFVDDIVYYVNLSTPTKIGLIVIGLLLIIIGGRNSLVVILRVTSKYKNFEKCDRGSINKMLYMDKVQSRGPKLVAIGGGTGLSALLRGLKEHTGNITAIVTVTDDGGGSGVLREEMGMLPPGDIRNCIMALANAEPSMDRLLNYRFKEGRLKGQSFGNLFIAAMGDMYDDFNLGIKEMSNVLAVNGDVLPMTVENVRLCAKLENGHIVEGESKIPEESIEQNSPIESVFTLPSDVKPMPEAIKAICEADCIVLGPGSLYTSIMPNLLVEDIVKAIKKSKAKKIYIANIMTQPGETTGYSIIDHIDAIEKHAKADIIDFVIVNTEKISKRVIKKYLKEDSDLIEITDEEIEKIERDLRIQVYKGDIVSMKDGAIRHSPRLAEIIMDVYFNHSQKIYKRDHNDGYKYGG